MDFKVILLFLLSSLFVISTLGDDHTRLLLLERDFFFWRLNDRPEFASNIGHFRNSDRLEEFTLGAMKERMLKAQDYLDTLNSIDKTKISEKDQIDYSILQDMLETYIDGYKWREWNYLNPINWLEGNQRDPVLFVDSTPFDNRGDFENYIARLNDMPGQFDEYISLFQEAVRLGRTSSILSLHRVPEQISLILDDSVHDSVYFSPFVDYLDDFNNTIPQDVRQNIKQRGEMAVRGLLDAFNKLQDYITEEYFPHTRPGLGVGSLEGGRDFYKSCLKWYLSFDMTPEEVYELGLREVQRLATEMRTIMDRQGYSGYSIREFFAEINKLDGMLLHTEEEIIQEYEHIIFERIESKLSPMFRDRPGLPIKVEPMPYDGSRGQFISGSPDGIRPAIFYANTHRPVPKYTMMSLAMHESNPGHHLQFGYAMTADLHEFRKNQEYSEKYRVPFAFPSYTAYVEGWALYAESLGLENNLYENDFELMGYYDSEIIRACRLVVDTGIHYFNWTKEDAISFFTNHTSESDEGLDLEIDRYITWPGQAVTYKVGELKIRELRDFAERELGEDFNIADFHMVILENGAVPLSILEQEIIEWVNNYQKEKEASLDTDDCECPSTPKAKVRCQRSSKSRADGKESIKDDEVDSKRNSASFTRYSLLSWSSAIYTVVMGLCLIASPLYSGQF